MPGPRRRAFLLGCDSGGLEHCERDAERMRDVLARRGFEPCECLTTTKLATWCGSDKGSADGPPPVSPAALVDQSLLKFLQDCRRGDAVLVYSSGHSRFAHGVFGLVVGTDLNDPGHLLDVRGIASRFRQHRSAADRLLILDCCEAGDAAIDFDWNAASGDWLRIWVAAGSTQTALELDGETSGGLFTASILRGLDMEAGRLAENGLLRVNALSVFVRQQLDGYRSPSGKPAPKPGLFGNDAKDILLAEGLAPPGPSSGGSGECDPAKTEHTAIPRSRSPDPAVQALGDQLDAAYEEQDRLMCEGGDTAEVSTRILDLRRRIREGGRLRAGDFLLEGRYKLLDSLKKGGFGTIYRAFDTRDRRLVAIKVLHGQFADDRSRIERFFRGAHKMAELHHQGIVRVLDPQEVDEGHHFFVMEYLAGGDLRDAVLKERPPPERVFGIVLTVGAALAFAHARGIVHRDVKPANIVLDAAGEPKLTDFDLVRAADTTGGTRTGAMGTFGYAAPEALSRPQDADARADVFGLAMTAVFAFGGAEPELYEVIRDPEGLIDRLPIPNAVKPVLVRAIAWKPQDRYQDAQSFCEALRQALASPASGPPPILEPAAIGDARPSGARIPAEIHDGKTIVRYFVSYARKDQKLKDDLLQRLQVRFDCAKEYVFAPWQDGDILPGEDWHRQIQRAIEGCHFGLLLVSYEFLSRPYIREHELPRFVAPDPSQPAPRTAVPVGLKKIRIDAALDMKGLEHSQIFLYRGKFFSEYRGDHTRDEFAEELFHRILVLVRKHLGPAPAPEDRKPDAPHDVALVSARSRPIPFRDPFRDGSGDAPEMIWLPGGTFRMGSPQRVGDSDEHPAHDVTLSHYAVGKYPVTVGEFRRFVDATGYRTEAEEGDGAWVWNQGNPETKPDASWHNPYMQQDDRHPVVCITWNDAEAYCKWLGERTGQAYALLTEAQWEHACQAGSDAAFCFGDDETRLGGYAWFRENAGDGTRPAGEKKANAWHLHDMHGNVGEWCADWYVKDYYVKLADL